MSWNPFQQAQNNYGAVNPQQAQQATNPWTSPHYIAQQQAASQQAYQQMMSNHWRDEPKYMFEGRKMTFMQLMDTLYPDDCAEKTHLILKFKKDQE